MSWESKIVKHSKESPSSLTGLPLNFREHPVFQRHAVADSIQEVRFIRSITVIINSGYVIDGHERLWQALEHEQNSPNFKVDVEWVSLTDHEEKLALSVLDATCNLARVDSRKLEDILHEINTGSEALSVMLADMREKASDQEEREESQETGEKIFVNDETVWQLMTGNLPHMTVRDSLIQMTLPAGTLSKIATLIIKEHAGITDGQEAIGQGEEG